MTNQEAIKYLQQLYPNGGHCWLDEQRIEALGMAIDALQEEHVNEDLEEVVNTLWKDAQGDDLPEIDREVIALLNNGKVVFAHRPYKGKYLGKNLTTGNIETFENQTFDKGEWNFPDVKYWLDCQIPKIEED